MTKITIFSGFLGAGKTTLIKKLIAEAYAGERLMLIENEFGEIGVDGGFLKDAGVQITEMNSGCICCSLVGDFGRALEKVLADYAPDRILIEPSGVGKLSDVIRAVEEIHARGGKLDGTVVVVDAKKCRMYMKNFGEFFNDQVEHAGAIVLSHTGGLSPERVADCVAALREQNAEAVMVTTPWEELAGVQIAKAIERQNTLSTVLEELAGEAHHHHDDDDEDGECHCHHHDDDDEDGECHCHHHDDEDEDGECHCHHHDDEDEDGECHCHHHDDEDEDGKCHCHHHHHHDADEVFSSWGTETPRAYTREELDAILRRLDSGEFGVILRAKGIVPATGGQWFHFDYVPEEPDVRTGSADVTGRLCVIGSGIDSTKLQTLFGV